MSFIHAIVWNVKGTLARSLCKIDSNINRGLVKNVLGGYSTYPGFTPHEEIGHETPHGLPCHNPGNFKLPLIVIYQR